MFALKIQRPSFASLKCFGTLQKAVLPELNFDFGELEPHMSAQIVEVHYKRHHNTYVNNYNATLEQIVNASSAGDVSKVVSLSQALKFNGGGHVNHSLFWENLDNPRKRGGHVDSGSEVIKEITRVWGSLENFQAEFAARTAAIQGSGYGWLVYNTTLKSIGIAETSNQDPLPPQQVPLLGISFLSSLFSQDSLFTFEFSL